MELDFQTIKALSSPTRLNILKVLQDGEVTPVWLSEELDKSQSTVVSHLSTLQEAGLVEKDKQDGRRRVVYSITDRADVIIRGKEKSMKFSLPSSIFTGLLGMGMIAYEFLSFGDSSAVSWEVDTVNQGATSATNSTTSALPSSSDLLPVEPLTAVGITLLLISIGLLYYSWKT